VNCGSGTVDALSAAEIVLLAVDDDVVALLNDLLALVEENCETKAPR
jgi:hypothetical protein